MISFCLLLYYPNRVYKGKCISVYFCNTFWFQKIALNKVLYYCTINIIIVIIIIGARGILVVKALGYKPEGSGFEIPWGEILNLPNSSGRTRPWGLLSL
jgi:hypothetical protein